LLNIFPNPNPNINESYKIKCVQAFEGRGVTINLCEILGGEGKNFSATGRGGPLGNMQIKIKMHQPSTPQSIIINYNQ
jgi:hypothetical protein